MADMEWIGIIDGAIRTGRGERTIRRWAKAHEKDYSAVKKENGKIFINANVLAEKYPFIVASQKAAERQAEQNTNQMHIVSNSETINHLSEHLKTRDEEIKLLLTKKPKSTKWIILGFVALILLLLCGLYWGFINYQKELKESHIREIQLIEQKSDTIANSKDKTIDGQTLQINLLQAKNTQQRLELAQKDRLIAELYNDTKAQNKKLLELTESLQAKSAKTDQFKNNSVKN